MQFYHLNAISRCRGMLETTTDRQGNVNGMLSRFATLALTLLIAGALPASAQNPARNATQNPAPKLNYLSDIIDLTELVPPPPPADSEAGKQDLLEVMEMQEARTEPQVKRAIADNVLSIYRFEDILGPKFKKENLPALDAFFEKAQADARAILIAAKNAVQRPRPAAFSSEVVALGGTPRLPTAYPSGGVVFTTLTAIVLAKMVPEKRFEISERSREYGVHRVVLGQHFPRDVRGGEISGTVIAYALMERPEFVRDLQAARTELRRALGLPAEAAK